MLNRRQALCVTVASVGSMPPLAASASSSGTHSEMDKLIASYHAAERAYLDCITNSNEIWDSIGSPHLTQVRVGSVRLASGGHKPLMLSSADNIKKEFEERLQHVPPQGKANLLAQMQSKIDEWHRLFNERKRKEADASLTALNAESDRRYNEFNALYDQLIATKPKTLNEARQKIQALSRRLLERIENGVEEDFLSNLV